MHILLPDSCTIKKCKARTGRRAAAGCFAKGRQLRCKRPLIATQKTVNRNVKGRQSQPRLLPCPPQLLREPLFDPKITFPISLFAPVSLKIFCRRLGGMTVADGAGSQQDVYMKRHNKNKRMHCFSIHPNYG